VSTLFSSLYYDWYIAGPSRLVVGRH